MKSFVTLLILLLPSLVIIGQSQMKGHLLDEFGNDGWAEILLNGEPTAWMENGQIDLNTSKKGLNTITLKYFGHYTMNIQVECNDPIVELGKVYLVSNRFWLDGPKNGFVSQTYDSGNTKYVVRIKKWKMHGESKFYNEKGYLTQNLFFKKGQLLKILVRENEKMKELEFQNIDNGEILIIYKIGPSR